MVTLVSSEWEIQLRRLEGRIRVARERGEWVPVDPDVAEALLEIARAADQGESFDMEKSA